MVEAKEAGQIWTFQKDGWQGTQANGIKQSTESPSTLKEIRQLISEAEPALGRIIKNEGENTDWYDFTGTMTENGEFLPKAS